MKLLSALKRQPADNCVILTYNADLLFFEHLLFESLYGAGCRNTLVLCDPLQYSTALGDIAQLRYAGQRYLLTAGRTSPAGAFHPKLVFLTTADSGRLIIGSGNLTRAGYTRNWEVVTLVEYSDKQPDPAAWMMCRWAFEMLSLIVHRSDPGGLAQQRLDQLLGTTQWLRRDPPAPPDTRAWPLHNLNAPLLDQVLTRYGNLDGSSVSEAVVISPYFDLNARAIEELLVRFRPEQLRLYTQGLRPGVDPTRLHGILARSGVQFEAGRLEAEGRRLHAKTLMLRTQQGVWLASGSANFSAPAWLCRATAGNTECIVLRHEPDPAYFDAWLEELMVTAQPLDVLGELERPAREDVEPTPRALTLLGANLRGTHLSLRFTALISSNGPFRLRLESDTSHNLDFERWQQDDDSIITLEIPPHMLASLERPTLVAVEVASSGGELFSNFVLLHNEDALRRFSQPLIRRDRPRVPEGMTPESYEHCARLLEMLHELLATNTAQLSRNGRRIVAADALPRRNVEVTDEGRETYDPTEHFVVEPVAPMAQVTGADLYVDFYDRLTYEEVLRAAVAAAYHPAPQDTTGEGASVIPIVSITPLGPPDNGNLRAQMLARIANGFVRLIGNFMEGLNDPKYMEDIPPAYLIELFVIITTYLRVVWRDGMLANPLFIDHSLKLLRTFGGRDGVLFSLRARDWVLTIWSARSAGSDCPYKPGCTPTRSRSY